jgi:hypothetical protein
MPINYSSTDILQQLDNCAADFTFPVLDNGYVYPVTSRLVSYRDDKRWAIIIEDVGFNYRGGGHNGIQNCLYVYGNCIDFPPGTNNDNFLTITENSNEGDPFDDETMSILNPEVNSILLHGNKIQINHVPNYYREKGIELEDPPNIMIWEFLRGLLPDYRSDLLATEKELRHRVPKDIQEFIKLDEWFHPDISNSETPSQNETFQMLAISLETGDRNRFHPTKPPNTHWRNWPEGGTL